jgi:hypothetical protein
MREVQGVYRSQNVAIDDKHIEIIVGQMMCNVSVVDPGDTGLLPGAVVEKFHFRAVNGQMVAAGKKPATATPLLLGITKASLQSESFISAASFQETTKVLTEAALSGRTDNLAGLKENVILGHLVPAGTGFREYHEKGVKKLAPVPALAAVGAGEEEAVLTIPEEGVAFPLLTGDGSEPLEDPLAEEPRPAEAEAAADDGGGDPEDQTDQIEAEEAEEASEAPEAPEDREDSEAG